jgi:hypothetical protein
MISRRAIVGGLGASLVICRARAQEALAPYQEVPAERDYEKANFVLSPAMGPPIEPLWRHDLFPMAANLAISVVASYFVVYARSVSAKIVSHQVEISEIGTVGGSTETLWAMSRPAFQPTTYNLSGRVVSIGTSTLADRAVYVATRAYQGGLAFSLEFIDFKNQNGNFVDFLVKLDNPGSAAFPTPGVANVPRLVRSREGNNMIVRVVPPGTYVAPGD